MVGVVGRTRVCVGVQRCLTIEPPEPALKLETLSEIAQVRGSCVVVMRREAVVARVYRGVVFLCERCLGVCGVVPAASGSAWCAGACAEAADAQRDCAGACSSVVFHICSLCSHLRESAGVGVVGCQQHVCGCQTRAMLWNAVPAACAAHAVSSWDTHAPLFECMHPCCSPCAWLLAPPCACLTASPVCCRKSMRRTVALHLQC